jgi:hypothetical protein
MTTRQIRFHNMGIPSHISVEKRFQAFQRKNTIYAQKCLAQAYFSLKPHHTLASPKPAATQGAITLISKSAAGSGAMWRKQSCVA